MGGARKFDKLAGVRSDAVKKKTGKDWAEWIAVLDKAGAKTMDHKEIVAIVREKHGVGSWWQQRVTVGYEQARGKREVHQTSSGYQVSVSKTINVPLEKLFHAWKDDRARAKWLPGPAFVVRKTTAVKSLRASWRDGHSGVDVHFTSKGERKSQVSLQHHRLSGSDEVTRMRSLWRKSLDDLKKMLEK